MNYKQALYFINSSKSLGSNLGLTRIEILCELLGNPQSGLKFIHIAGTNGKGSICAMLASVCKNAGLKTGLYISPYLDDIRESILINGRKITKVDFSVLCVKLNKASKIMSEQDMQPTEYELMTALAFLAFEKNGCEIVVLETGLGGRLDATNVIKNPLISIIASISLDHINILGHTIEEITLEKCGIIKKDTLTISYPLQNSNALKIIKDIVKQENNRFIIPDIDQLSVQHSSLNSTSIIYKERSLRLPLLGEHQIYNAVTAIEAIFALRDVYGFNISDANIKKGITATKHSARLELLCKKPIVLLDGAHNTQGAQALADFIKQKITNKPLVLVMGMFADKAYAEAVALLAPLCNTFIAITPPNPRALPAEQLRLEAAKCTLEALAVEGMEAAISLAFNKCNQTGAIIICGSLSIAAGAKKAVKNYTISKS